MMNMNQFAVLRLMASTDAVEAAKIVPTEITVDTKTINIAFAGNTYAIAIAMQMESTPRWHIKISHQGEELSIKHSIDSVYPEVSHDGATEFDMALICHVEHEVFSRLAKRFPKTVEMQNSTQLPPGYVVVREFLTNKGWVRVKNPTQDPSKKIRQCMNILANQKYTGYKPVYDKYNRIQIREYPAKI